MCNLTSFPTYPSPPVKLLALMMNLLTCLVYARNLRLTETFKKPEAKYVNWEKYVTMHRKDERGMEQSPNMMCTKLASSRLNNTSEPEGRGH